MQPSLPPRSFRESGAALVVVLVLMALMAVVCVSFLVSSLKDVAISNQSTSLVQTPELAELAVNQFVQDIQREIKAGSVLPDRGRVQPELSATVLYPATPQSAVPDRSSAAAKAGDGLLSAPPNLVKQSAYGRKFYDAEALSASGVAVYPRADKFPVASRASNLSTTGAISDAKWNRALLLPRANPDSATDFSPLASGVSRMDGGAVEWKWKAPDWIFLNKQGNTPADVDSKISEARVDGSNPLVARYAYQVYDIGGLLDLNVAGYDPKESSAIASRRGSQAFANLEVLGFSGDQLEKLIRYRNPLSTADSASGKIGAGAPFYDRYANYVFSGSLNLGFLRVANDSENPKGLSNRGFVSRLSMIDFIKSLGNGAAEKAHLLNTLEFFTHFSRSIEQPSYYPGFYEATGNPEKAVFTRPTIVPPAGKVDDVVYPMVGPGMPASGDQIAVNQQVPNWRFILNAPYCLTIANNRGGNSKWGTLDERGFRTGDKRFCQDVINPGFLEVRISANLDKGSKIRRIDGSRFSAGEPLVKKRFPLERLAWVTSKGPSADLNPNDPQYNPAGTPEAIHQSFGLKWKEDGRDGSQFWLYDHEKVGGSYGGIRPLEHLAQNDPENGLPREPDFFEILKAAIAVGSLGKSAVQEQGLGEKDNDALSPATYNHLRDRNTDFQIFDIGVNIIDQYDEDSFPTVVKVAMPSDYLDGSLRDPLNPPLYVARGVENLPYLYRFHVRGIRDQGTNLKYSEDPPLRESPYEVTSDSGFWTNANNFRPGVIFVMGIPELWNPHAPPLKQIKPENTPTEFRAVADSAAPEALVDVLLKISPRINDSNSSVRLRDAISAGVTGWGAQVGGFFGFTPRGKDASILNLSEDLMATVPWLPQDPSKSVISTNSGTFSAGSRYGWPIEFSTASLSGNGRVTATASIFWPYPDPLIASSVSLFSISKPPKDGFQAIVSVDPTLIPKSNYFSLFNASPEFAGLKGLSLPTTSEFCPDPRELYLSRSFSINQLDHDVGSNPLFQARTWTTFLQADAPKAEDKYWSPSPQNGNPLYIYSEASEKRGTELFFNLGSITMFREPTGLCWEGLPNGSNLRSGPGNFFSALNGGVVTKGPKWTGFSLGEVPLQSLWVAKAYNFSPPVPPVPSVPPGGDSRPDMVADQYGRLPLSAGLSGSGYRLRLFVAPVNIAGLVNESKITVRLQFKSRGNKWITYDERFISLPGGNIGGLPGFSNLANLSYGGFSGMTPVVGNEDEVELQIEPSVSGVFPPSGSQAPDSAKSMFRSSSFGDLQPGFLKKSGRPIPWGPPVVTSYDPRGPRFGNPARKGSNSFTTVTGGANALMRYFDQEAYPGERNGFLRATSGLTDRPKSLNVVSVNGPGPNFGTCPEVGTPVSIMRNFLTPLKTNVFNRRRIAGDVWKEVPPSGQPGRPDLYLWYWITNLNSKTGKPWLSPISMNAYDYGWMPRLTGAGAPQGSSPGLMMVAFGYQTVMDDDWPHFLTSVHMITGKTSSNNNYFYVDRLNGIGEDLGVLDSLRIGSFSENVAPTLEDPYAQAYADPDDVVRRAMGGHAFEVDKRAGGDGLPMAQDSSGATVKNRPVILDRPFRSVAELGYAFRGAPWKNLCFSMPESGDAALLDVFCLSEVPALSLDMSENPPVPAPSQPLVAGKLNLNTRQAPVLRALLEGALRDELDKTSTLTKEMAEAAADVVIDRTTGGKLWNGPFRNVSELVGKLFGKNLPENSVKDPSVYNSFMPKTKPWNWNDPKRNEDMDDKGVRWSFSGLSSDLTKVFKDPKDQKTARMRESVLRALADSGQTRVWNLMVDLIVQNGRLPRGATSLAQFSKEGEARVWVYLAIDRFTGEILDKQAEWVPE